MLTLSFSQQPSSPASSSEDEGKPPSLDGNDPPDDVFLMVTQQHWENKILWEVPYNPGPSITASGMELEILAPVWNLKYWLQYEA